MPKPLDFARERRIREHLHAIDTQVRGKPEAAARLYDYLEQQAMSESSIISIRLPAELVERLDRLVEAHPERVKPSGGTGRVTRNSAIRLILERGVEALERHDRA